jgi:hypothetical protein
MANDELRALLAECKVWVSGANDSVARTILLNRITAALAEKDGGWMPIETAPRDGSEFLAYTAAAHGLPPFVSLCKWHPDAGFCTDELRNVTHWQPLPPLPTEREV